MDLSKIKNLELETVKVLDVDLDIYFTYNRDFGFEVQSIETKTDTQDLTKVLGEWVLIQVEEDLEDIYRRRGWL
jgi:hypothetical protein